MLAESGEDPDPTVLLEAGLILESLGRIDEAAVSHTCTPVQCTTTFTQLRGRYCLFHFKTCVLYLAYFQRVFRFSIPGGKVSRKRNCRSGELVYLLATMA